MTESSQTSFDRAAQALDFTQCLELLAGFASCAPGADSVRGLAPLPDAAELAFEAGRVEAAVALLQRGAAPSLAGLSDDRPLLESLVVPFSHLDGAEFIQVAGNLTRLGRLRELLLGGAGPLPDEARAALDPQLLVKGIEAILDADGRVRDNASPELRRLRKARGRIAKEIETLLRDELKRHADDLMDSVLVERNGRLALSVKAGKRRTIAGITHGLSGSGQTVFIEPAQAVSLNNEGEALSADELIEIRRLLTLLGDALRGELQRVLELYAAGFAWDSLFARARFALACDAIILPPLPPASTADGTAAVRIKLGRHPLLDERLRAARQRAGLDQGAPEKVVPISLEIEPERPLLLISGPNAGGKTAALKLLGLFVLMNQSAIPVPAEAGSTLPFFKRLHTDIGEDQSLLTSLSTFSARMTHLARTLVDLESPSLVLLDELGTGTDPEEGTALAKAALLALLEGGAMVAGTTHFDELKAFALAHPRMRCAAARFDEVTLRPLYRLDFDHPGRSYGLELAARSGVPVAVVENARRLLDPDHRALDDLLRGLQEKINAAEDEKLALRQLADGERRTAAERLTALQAEFTKLRGEYGGLLDEALAGTEGRERASAVKTVKAKLTAIDKKAQKAGLQSPPPPPRQFQPGDRVKDRRFGVEGIVVTVSGNRIAVRTGSMKMDSSPADLEWLSSGVVPALQPANKTILSTASIPKSAAREINLLGKYVEEGIAELEAFIDSASRSGHQHIRVVHGHGTGRLKTAVRDFLRRCPVVSAHEPAPQNEGGDGATLVTLDV